MTTEENQALVEKLKGMETKVSEVDSGRRPDVPYQGSIVLETPTQESPLQAASVGIRMAKLGMLLLGTTLIVAIPYALGALFGVGWLKTTGYVLAMLGIALAFWQALHAKVAVCPFCHQDMGTSVDYTLSPFDHNERMPCEHCYEYVISHKGTVRAMTEEDAAQFNSFEAPVFEGMRWPDECIVSGAEVTHYGSATKNKLEFGHLLVGTIAVSKAGLEGIPYGEGYDDDISLKIRNEKLYLVFPTLAQQRRYLHVNNVTDIVKIES